MRRAPLLTGPLRRRGCTRRSRARVDVRAPARSRGAATLRGHSKPRSARDARRPRRDPHSPRTRSRPAELILPTLIRVGLDRTRLPMARAVSKPERGLEPLTYRLQGDSADRLNTPVLPANGHVLRRGRIGNFGSIRLISAGLRPTGDSVGLNDRRSSHGIALPAGHRESGVIRPAVGTLGGRPEQGSSSAGAGAPVCPARGVGRDAAP